MFAHYKAKLYVHESLPAYPNSDMQKFKREDYPARGQGAPISDPILKAALERLSILGCHTISHSRAQQKRTCERYDRISWYILGTTKVSSGHYIRMDLLNDWPLSEGKMSIGRRRRHRSGATSVRLNRGARHMQEPEFVSCNLQLQSKGWMYPCTSQGMVRLTGDHEKSSVEDC